MRLKVHLGFEKNRFKLKKIMLTEKALVFGPFRQLEEYGDDFTIFNNLRETLGK